jgi:hypothetical protein
MKQVSYAIGMLMLIISGQASAQTSETAFMTSSSIINSPFASGVKASTVAAKVSVTALDRFSKDYKDVKNAEWIEVPNGYRAYFQQDAMLTAVDYTKKGKLYSVIRYGKDLLPADLKAKVNEMFGDMQIKEVTEVKIADYATKAFVIVLDGKASLKTIQIIENEIIVLHEAEK